MRSFHLLIVSVSGRNAGQLADVRAASVTAR